jgi:DNA-binding transcriptional MerR regulator
MYLLSMGSEELVSRKEAAAILGTTIRMVNYWSDKEILKPYPVDGDPLGRLMYSREEVSALAEARERGEKLSDVALTAHAAYAASRVAQRKLDMLMRILGYGPPLSTNPESVRALHLEAEEDCKRVINGEERVNYWADKFFGICDIYMETVAEVMNTEEPWEPYLTLMRRLAKQADYEEAAHNPLLSRAYYRLSASRTAFRQSFCTYLSAKHGVRKAKKAFPHEFGSEMYRIMRYAVENR